MGAPLWWDRGESNVLTIYRFTGDRKSFRSLRIGCLGYGEAMHRIAQTKNGFAPKVCERCGLPFEWRKKWARDWENVKYCSEKCKKG
ncbi:DUF2256 domain-containing protein [Aurantimicrobium minutum]|uniref:DUF2256 domain-containing protein n=1 Tax=Aurantimicrobium minutum TaxID=708131 RepID=UPI002474AAA0|nr:DUF2256 domain-containing protein [Aurantimicrobium minutum]MDH6423369.1 hypothetical protein [Aurantimicrobium minutum]